MASENMCKAAVSIIAGRRVSPAVLHQFVSHSIPLSPHAPSFFSLCLSLFPFSSPLPSPNTHTYTDTQTLVSIMNLSCGWLYNPWGVLFQTHTHPLSSPCTRREREGGGRWRKGETGVVGRRKKIDGQQTGRKKCEKNEKERKVEMHRCKPQLFFLPSEPYRHFREVRCLPSWEASQIEPSFWATPQPSLWWGRLLQNFIISQKIKPTSSWCLLLVRRSFCHINSFHMVAW